MWLQQERAGSLQGTDQSVAKPHALFRGLQIRRLEARSTLTFPGSRRSIREAAGTSALFRGARQLGPLPGLRHRPGEGAWGLSSDELAAGLAGSSFSLRSSVGSRVYVHACMPLDPPWSPSQPLGVGLRGQESDEKSLYLFFTLCLGQGPPLGLVPGTVLWWGHPENCRMLVASLASTHWMPVHAPPHPPV